MCEKIKTALPSALHHSFWHLYTKEHLNLVAMSMHCTQNKQCNEKEQHNHIEKCNIQIIEFFKFKFFFVVVGDR